MRKLIGILDSYSFARNMFVLKWRLSDECNYRCSYCLRSIHRDLRDEKQDEASLCKTGTAITNMLNKADFISEVKIDAIGGEPSILNLHKIFSYLVKDNKKIRHINLTTNLSQKADYYTSLFKMLADNNIRLTITASFHPEFVKMDKYFEKVKAVADVITKDNINCEIVSRVDNQDMVKEFYDICVKNGYDYKIEKDVKEKIPEELFVKSSIKNEYYYKYNKKSKTVEWSMEKKDGFELCDGRYLLLFENADPEVCKTRNEFYQMKDIDVIIPPNHIDPSGFYCTNSVNFINVLYDKITSCRELGERIPVEDFEIYTLEESMCPYGGRNGSCSICGSLSIAKYLSLLD